MAPNAGDRHFRVFRVPASVFQVPVGGDGRPLADVLRGERAPMDALHRRPEAACPNVWQRIGVSEHDGRQAGAGPRSRNRLRAWERARRFMGTAVRPSFLTDRRDDMGVASFRNAACRKGRGKGVGGGDVMAAVRGKGIPASYGGEGGASGGRRPSSSFRVILPSTVREPSRSVRREVRMPASSKTIVRGWGAVLGLEDVRKACDARRRASFRGRLLSVVSVALVVSGLVVVSVPVMLQSRSAGEQSATSDRLEKTVAGWPYPRAENELKEARAYNRDLASHGQYVLGEAKDPFTQTKGSVSDKRYLSMLDAGGGVMGSVTIPKIGVDLPIYHGTSESTLELGAGHLYGSSLPVGGKGTHAVITGHRGLVKALMFTRLDELKKGDSFYIKVMGETLGYKVDRVSVIEPSDVSKLRIVEGEDRVTLMTCTPYGVNTHRLLVSGLRAAIPAEVPDESQVIDPRPVPLSVVAAYVLAALCIPLLFTRDSDPRRHSSGVKSDSVLGRKH